MRICNQNIEGYYMKYLKKVDNYYILIILLSCLGCLFGLADLDYYWQADLGKRIVNDFDFYGCYKQIWGTKGTGTYYDHEWLSNVLFYFFSLIKYKPLVWLKLFICIITGLETVRFLKHFSIKNFSVLILYVFYILVFCKIKAYSISVCFLMEELIQIDAYRKDTTRYKPLVCLGLLCILWNNMHSGSIPLFFVVAGVVWLCEFRNRKLAIAGVVIAISTLLNPYGYKLLVFNFSHNFDSIMKEIVMDWRGMDAKTVIGAMCGLVLLYIMFLFAYASRHHKSIDWYLIVLSFLFSFMSMQSVRHTIYLLPVMYLIVQEVFDDFAVKINWNVLVVVACFGLFSIALAGKNYSDYSIYHIDDKLVSLIDKTVNKSGEGFCNDINLVSEEFVRRPCFITGGYPLVEGRIKDMNYLLNYANKVDIERIVKHYDLDKFVIYKYNGKVDFLDGMTYNPLYSYLSTSEGYVCLWENDGLAYFVTKEIADAIK